MATSYPISKQTFTNPTGTSDTNVLDHGGMHTNTNDTLGALQDTVGYSADTATSVLGRLSSITGSDVAVGKAATQTLLNKTLTAPVVNGSSGNMTLLASPDGSEYNINASTTGTLSIYGQAAATLHVNLLDGNLQTAGTTRLTNAGVLQNVSIDGGSNTLTNTPGAQLGYAQNTSTGQSGFSTETDITGCSVTVTVPAGGRNIKITGFCTPSGTVSNDEIRMNIKEGSTVLGMGQVIAVAGKASTIEASTVQTPSSGSHTYKLSLVRVSGTGTITNNVATTLPSFILVEAK